LAFFLATPPTTFLLQALNYLLGLLFTLPFAYATIVQVRIFLAVRIPPVKRGRALASAPRTARLEP